MHFARSVICIYIISLCKTNFLCQNKITQLISINVICNQIPLHTATLHKISETTDEGSCQNLLAWAQRPIKHSTNAVIKIGLMRLSPREWPKVCHGTAKYQFKKIQGYCELDLNNSLFPIDLKMSCRLLGHFTQIAKLGQCHHGDWLVVWVQSPPRSTFYIEQKDLTISSVDNIWIQIYMYYTWTHVLPVQSYCFLFIYFKSTVLPLCRLL